MLADKELLSNPKLVELLKFAIKKVNDLTERLSFDPKLLNEQGISVLKERDMWQVIVDKFDSRIVNKSIVELKKRIENI